ncbi:MAG: tetratricopeptide repeat protein [Candidatus Bathyarchaeota archaeon]|nr:tetratricopeptide repeat protein [Candidatus Bathyarchaeota archaeon]
MNRPLKILVVISQPLDQPYIETAPPVKKIQDELRELIETRQIVVHFLMPPTRESLLKHLGRGYDVLQFYGHGGLVNGKGCLAFENELGLTSMVYAQDLSVVLQGSGVQLVVLCACHSSATLSQDLFAGVAQSIVNTAVPAVVGWGFEAPVDSALAFMEQFYAVLANEKQLSIRKAVAQARKALYNRGTAHFPTLFERTAHDIIASKGSWSDEALQTLYTEPMHNLKEPLGIHNLLVGRQADLMELSRGLASKENAMVLWGFSGIGKTALAVRGIHDRFMWRFPDGIWYIELQGGKKLDTILAELCKNMSMPIPPEIEKKEQHVLNRLAKTRTLLLLNNFEDVDTDQEINSFLNRVSSSSKVLITSRREPKQASWRRYELKEMRSDDAIRLFRSIAGRSGIPLKASDLDDVSEICRRVDHIPVAITYVAGSLAKATIKDMLKDLDKTPPDPVKAGFEYAYKNLSVDARKLLARLSILERPFPLNAIKALSEPSEKSLTIPNWKACKDELRSSALLLFGQKLFSLLRMTRQLASEHLEDPRRWHSIAADYFTSKEQIDPFQAFDHMFAAERWRESVELIVGTVAGLHDYGFAEELVPRLKLAAQIAEERINDRVLQSCCLDSLGTVLSEKGRHNEALSAYDKALSIQTDLLRIEPTNRSYQLIFAGSQSEIGYLLFKMGNFKEAKKYLLEAIKICRYLLKTDPRNLNYQSHMVTILDSLGNILSSMGKYDDAIKNYEEAMGIGRTLLRVDPNNFEYRSGVALTLLNFGTLLFRMGRFDDALKYLPEALSMHRSFLQADPNNWNYRSNTAMCLNNLGCIIGEKGKFDDALRYLTEALEIYRSFSQADPDNIALQSNLVMTLINIAKNLSSLDAYPDAIKNYEEAIAIGRQLLRSDPDNAIYQSRMALAFTNLGSVLIHVGRAKESIDPLMEALKAYRELLAADHENLGYQSDVFRTQLNLGRSLVKVTKYDDAFSSYLEALQTGSDLLEKDPSNVHNQLLMAMTMNNLGNLLRLTRRVDDAFEYMIEALNLHQSLLESDPENPDYQKNVAQTKNNLAVILGEMLSRKEIKKASKCLSFVYKSCLEHKGETFSEILMSIVKIVKELRKKGKKETADRIGSNLVKILKRERLDRFKEFIRHLENESGDISSGENA